jgi:hypothetical protein
MQQILLNATRYNRCVSWAKMSASAQRTAGLVVVGEKHYSDSRPANGDANDGSFTGGSGDGSVGAMRPIDEEQGTGTTPSATAASEDTVAQRSNSGVPLLRVSSAPSGERYRCGPGPTIDPGLGPKY